MDRIIYERLAASEEIHWWITGRRAIIEASEQPFRVPVQYVNRPNLDFRGFAGTVASGSIAEGDEVVVANPASGRESSASSHRAVISNGRWKGRRSP